MEKVTDQPAVTMGLPFALAEVEVPLDERLERKPVTYLDKKFVRMWARAGFSDVEIAEIAEVPAHRIYYIRQAPPKRIPSGKAFRGMDRGKTEVRRRKRLAQCLLHEQRYPSTVGVDEIARVRQDLINLGKLKGKKTLPKATVSPAETKSPVAQAEPVLLQKGERIVIINEKVGAEIYLKADDAIWDLCSDLTKAV